MEEIKNLLLERSDVRFVKSISDNQMVKLIANIIETKLDLNIGCFEFNVSEDTIIEMFVSKIKNGYDYKNYNYNELELMMKQISIDIKMKYIVERMK